MPSISSTLRLLRPYRGEFNAASVFREIRATGKQFRRAQTYLNAGPHFRASWFQSLQPIATDFDGDEISVRLAESGCETKLKDLATLILPWRIGPYRLGDLFLDSEWRSHIKWKRLRPLFPQTPNMKIADVGCSNGYFLFKMGHALRPRLALGFDPIDRCWLQFHLLQHLLALPNTGFLPLGLSALQSFPNFFDLMVCMGVLYHQRDPYEAVRTLVNATASGGTVMLESLSIDTAEPVLLIPKERYAKMRNAWVIPSPSALAHLLERAGCRDVRIHRFGPITSEEQRRTPFAPYESLADFLDPADCSKTIEGYPAPHSTLVTGIRK